MIASLSPTSCLLQGLAGPCWVWSWQPGPNGRSGWLLAGILLLLMVLGDAAALHCRPPLAVERFVAPALPLGAWRPVRLRFENRQAQSATLTVFDHYPTAAADCADLPQTVTVEPGGWTELSYRLRPVVRGPWWFAPAQVWLASPRGWWRRRMIGSANWRWCGSIPTFAAIARYIRLVAAKRCAFHAGSPLFSAASASARNKPHLRLCCNIGILRQPAADRRLKARTRVSQTDCPGLAG